MTTTRTYTYHRPTASGITGNFRECLNDEFYSSNNSTVLLGKDTLLDLSKAPHVLIAGTTGSGKSVMMHSIIASLLLKNDPTTAKLYMIDPKRIEFSFYRDHPMCTVVYETEQAVSLLDMAVNEMERRFAIMDEQRKRIWNGEKLYIFIDELADLMLSAGKNTKDAKDAEVKITRLVQKGRAAGVHLIMATQHPTTDIISGIIKANCPTRIALKVKTIINSMVILDHKGAEQLKGKGDAILSTASGEEFHFQGAYLTDEDIELLGSAWVELKSEETAEPTVITTASTPASASAPKASIPAHASTPSKAPAPTLAEKAKAKGFLALSKISRALGAM